MIGSLALLEGVLARSAWGLDQDFGYRWRLGGDDPGVFAVHLRGDPCDDAAPGLLFARETGAGEGRRGAIMSTTASAATVAALCAVLLDDRGSGSLRDLQRLLDLLTGSPAQPVAPG